MTSVIEAMDALQLRFLNPAQQEGPSGAGTPDGPTPEPLREEQIMTKATGTVRHGDICADKMCVTADEISHTLNARIDCPVPHWDGNPAGHIREEGDPLHSSAEHVAGHLQWGADLGPDGRWTLSIALDTVNVTSDDVAQITRDLLAARGTVATWNAPITLDALAEAQAVQS